MRKFNRRIVLAVLLAFVAGFSLAVWAGPVLPVPSNLPAEVQALQGLEQFRASTGPLTGLPADSPVTREEILAELKRGLRDSGLELGEDEERHLPKIAFDFMFAYDPAQPDAIGITGILALYQKVTIDRLGREIMLPTSTLVMSNLTTMDKVEDTIKRAIRSAAGAFAETVKMANAGPQTAKPKAAGVDE